ncbi:VanZ family protein [Streptomyces sp. NEAU-S7GS2]|uniref:VanZ family protein n=1 Tax=Streptomyces sp. NEAU-S7GS2 TaxID=2202000 RepID=UPI000D6EF6F7|nr:VanZ family protein [Streptomyces sp. NEAU-S7GS2]AWN25394.1 VanZ family protein [Streptomyces sp. NEAU-S7GS2]
MPFAVIALLVGFAGALLTWPATRTRRTSQRVLLGLVWLWAAGVVSLTFGTPSGGGRPVNIALLDVSNPADLIDFLVNMALFLPGGILFAALGCRWFTAGLVGFLGSLAIETAQHLVRWGRTADINDLLSNTAGCLAGFVGAAVVLSILGRPTAPGGQHPRIGSQSQASAPHSRSGAGRR